MDDAGKAPDRFEIAANAHAAGQRLDRFLASGDLGLSRARIQALIRQGLVQVDGAPATRASMRLRGGEAIVINVPPPADPELRPRPVPFSILYEDPHIVVVDKPAGLVVHPGAGGEEETLVHGLLHRCRDLSGIGGVARPGIVHRLDRDTSGVMVVAKSDTAHQGLAAAFKARAVTKRYLALVRGRLDALEGEIHRPIGRHPVHRTRMAVDGVAAREARTLWRVEEGLPGATLLSVRILTGRTHQIRCHLASIGHPLLGDGLYGGPGRIEVAGRPVVIPRQMLHAATLSFSHPVTGAEITCEAPLPADFQAILERLRGLAGQR